MPRVLSLRRRVLQETRQMFDGTAVAGYVSRSVGACSAVLVIATVYKRPTSFMSQSPLHESC